MILTATNETFSIAIVFTIPVKTNISYASSPYIFAYVYTRDKDVGFGLLKHCSLISLWGKFSILWKYY